MVLHVLDLLNSLRVPLQGHPRTLLTQNGPQMFFTSQVSTPSSVVPQPLQQQRVGVYA